MRVIKTNCSIRVKKSKRVRSFTAPSTRACKSVSSTAVSVTSSTRCGTVRMKDHPPDYRPAVSLCAHVERPEAYTDAHCVRTAVKTLCSVDFQISCAKLWLEKSYKNPLTREKWRDCLFIILIRLGNANINFAVTYKEELAAYCEAKYEGAQ
jgi:hypothetical protein